MRFTFTEEQDQLRATVRKLLAGRARPRDRYEGSPGADRALWSSLADLGVAGLGMEPAVGGSGGDVIDQVAVAEEIGRALAPVPFLSSTMVAGPLLSGIADGEQRSRMGKGVALGKTLVATTLDGDRRAAAPSGDAWRVSGVGSFVLDGGDADIFLVDADVNGAGAATFAVERDAEGLTIIDLPNLDRTRTLARIDLDGAAAELLGEPGAATATAFAAARSRAALCLAAEAAGAGARALEMSADYAKSRRQFGTPIGTFQAVKHRIADMLVAVENARSAVFFGAWALAGDWPEAHVAVAMAKATATENAVRVVDGAVQVFGGIGCTWEHDIHLYLRRVKCCELLLGDPETHFEHIASYLLDGDRTASTMRRT